MIRRNVGTKTFVLTVGGLGVLIGIGFGFQLQPTGWLLLGAGLSLLSVWRWRIRTPRRHIPTGPHAHLSHIPISLNEELLFAPMSTPRSVIGDSPIDTRASQRGTRLRLDPSSVYSPRVLIRRPVSKRRREHLRQWSQR